MASYQLENLTTHMKSYLSAQKPKKKIVIPKLQYKLVFWTIFFGHLNVEPDLSLWVSL
jgi:hypothetical protein